MLRLILCEFNVLPFGHFFCFSPFKKHRSKQRREGHRSHPTQQKRDHDHLKKRAAELTRRILRGANRGESHDRNDGCT